MRTAIDTTGYTLRINGQAVEQPRAKNLGAVSVKSRSGSTVMDAHRQWAKRPADEAVYTFDELLTRAAKVRDDSREADPLAWSDLSIAADGERALRVVTPQGSAKLTHWATQQICTVVSAPTDYLTRLPAALAAQNLNHGLRENCARTGDALLLKQRTDSGIQIRSITSNRYERVWDAEIAELAHKLHTKGTWGPCEAFKTATGQTPRAWSEAKKLPLGWVGDRSSFIALADYEGAVNVNGSKLARFALLSNSEVGAQGLKIVFGLMDFACANFILWGCQQVTEVSARHVGDVRERFQTLTAPMHKALTSGERDDLRSGLQAAQNHLIGDDKAEVLKRVSQVTRLPMAHIEMAWDKAEETPRYGDPRSSWGMLSGLTEASQEIHANADKRTAADLAAAKLMDF